MTDTAPMPDAATAPISEIMQARGSGAINNLVWADNYAAKVEARLRGDTGTPAAPAHVSITQIPTAADQGVVIATNPGQAYRDAVGIEQGMRAALDGVNASAIAAKFDGITAEVYAPAKSAGDYTVPISHRASPEELAADSTVREALHAAQLPTITANTITAALENSAMSLQHADEPQLKAFGDREGAGLRQLWGDSFAAKIQAVDAFLDSTADRVPYVAALLANPRSHYLLADRRVVTALSQMIEGRSGARQ